MVNNYILFILDSCHDEIFKKYMHQTENNKNKLWGRAGEETDKELSLNTSSLTVAKDMLIASTKGIPPSLESLPLNTGLQLKVELEVDIFSLNNYNNISLLPP